MKGNNFKLASFNAASQLMQRLGLEKIKAGIAAKKARQEKRRKRQSGYGWDTGVRGRQAARYRQQMAYDAGLVSRRALPRDKKSWLPPPTEHAKGVEHEN
jgi:hypothetical protein